jgi:hypothetical protein
MGEAVTSRGEDEGLRRRAIEALGSLSPELAREALEAGSMEVEPDVLAWQGSLGEVHGHRVVLWLDPELCARVEQAPSVVDVLTAAVASAVARVPGSALAELEISARQGPRARATPYRGRL